MQKFLVFTAINNQKIAIRADKIEIISEYENQTHIDTEYSRITVKEDFMTVYDLVNRFSL